MKMYILLCKAVQQPMLILRGGKFLTVIAGASTQPGRPAEDPICEQPPPKPMIDQIAARLCTTCKTSLQSASSIACPCRSYNQSRCVWKPKKKGDYFATPLRLLVSRLKLTQLGTSARRCMASLRDGNSCYCSAVKDLVKPGPAV